MIPYAQQKRLTLQQVEALWAMVDRGPYKGKVRLSKDVKYLVACGLAVATSFTTAEATDWGRRMYEYEAGWTRACARPG